LISADHTLAIQHSIIFHVLRTVSVGVIVVDSEQKVVFWNHWMEQHSQHQSHLSHGKTFAELFPDMVGGKIHDVIKTTLSEEIASPSVQLPTKFHFPLYASQANAIDDIRLHQDVKIVALEVATQPRYCIIEITDVSQIVARERQLKKEAQELKSQTFSDDLTGVANRRHFNVHLEDEFRRSKRTASPLSLVMIDVDYFKKYNDKYGHQSGDQCLVQIAEAMSRVLARPCDLLARYGGEEFIAVLPDTNAAGALKIAETMRTEVEALSIAHLSSDIAQHVTISLGVFTQIPQPNTTITHLIGAADRALYRAKHAGRNCTVVYSSNKTFTNLMASEEGELQH
jgi:diguanylate cyclase (GGDEF)-like protein